MSYSIYSTFDGQECKYCGLKSSQYHVCTQAIDTSVSIHTKTQDTIPSNHYSSLSTSFVKKKRKSAIKNKKAFKRMSNYATLTLSNASRGKHGQKKQAYIRDSSENFDDVLSPEIHDNDYSEFNTGYYEDAPPKNDFANIQQEPKENNSTTDEVLDDVLEGISGILSNGQQQTPPSSNRAMSIGSDQERSSKTSLKRYPPSIQSSQASLRRSISSIQSSSASSRRATIKNESSPVTSRRATLKNESPPTISRRTTVNNESPPTISRRTTVNNESPPTISRRATLNNESSTASLNRSTSRIQSPPERSTPRIQDDHLPSSQQYSSHPHSPRKNSHGPFTAPAKKIPACIGCNHPVHPDDEDGFRIAALNGYFHAECFTCIVCRCEFDDDNPYVPAPEEGVAYCEQHFSQRFLEKCAACLKPIHADDKISFAFGRAFHSRHLRCHICKHRIRGPHVEQNGKAICEKDYQALSNSPTSTFCVNCDQPIIDKSISALGGTWHRECFSCTLCSRTFPDKKFYIYEGQPYCLQDYYKATNAFCGACSKPIQGVCIDVLEMGCRFHEDCWRCAGECGRRLTGVYYSYRGAAYCEADIDRVYKSHSSSKNNTNPKKRHTFKR